MSQRSNYSPRSARCILVQYTYLVNIYDEVSTKCTFLDSPTKNLNLRVKTNVGNTSSRQGDESLRYCAVRIHMDVG